MKTTVVAFELGAELAGRAELAASTDAAGRPRLAGLAVPYGVPSNPAQDGHRYLFTSGPDNADDLVDLVLEHDENALIGQLAAPWTEHDDGLDAEARVFGTTRGRDALTEHSEGARASFSVSAAITAFTVAADGVRHVKSWTARHLGFVRRPAFTQATGITLMASAANPTEGIAMTSTTTTVDAAAGAAGPTVTELPTPAEMPTVAELAELVREHLGNADHTGAHPLAAFADLSAFAAELQDAYRVANTERASALVTAFAVPDQVTGNNPGVVPPGWRSEIKMNLDAARPAIRGTGGPIGLPAAGMDASWPYFDGDLDTIIGEQLTQKAELSGVRIDIKKNSAPIKTAGTVSDISYQLLMRSSPSYLAAYLRICMTAWARYTEARFELALAAGGTDAGALDLTDAEALAATLFLASSNVRKATGSPADLVLVDTATWITAGSALGLPNPAGNPTNARGTAAANTLRVNVNGIDLEEAPFLPAGTLVATNGTAAKFAEQGPMVATAEDVRRLGRDVAVWGMYEDAEIYFPAGVQVYTAAGGE